MRRSLAPLLVLPVLVALSGCAAPAPAPIVAPWWDAEEVASGFTAGGASGALPQSEDEVAASVELGGASAGAYRAEVACVGPEEIAVTVGDGTSATAPCEEGVWTPVEFELGADGPLLAQIAGADAAGAWYIGFDRVDG